MDCNLLCFSGPGFCSPLIGMSPPCCTNLYKSTELGASSDLESAGSDVSLVLPPSVLQVQKNEGLHLHQTESCHIEITKICSLYMIYLQSILFCTQDIIQQIWNKIQN